MLKNRYKEILVGQNLMSLIRGLISIKRDNSTLLIHDKRFHTESYPGSFISEIEILSLMRIGKIYNIPELMDVRQFISPASQEFVSENLRLRLGRSPFENLRELLRKFPELMAKEDLDLVYQEGEKGFDQYLLSELKRYEALCFESRLKPKNFQYELQGPVWLKSIYKKFIELINQEYTDSQSLKYSLLLHFLGISAEEKIKTQLSQEEMPFYFFRMLSPLYRLQDFFLTNQLKRRFLLLGGDFKESYIQYWQLHENKFENLLLASFEGVISGQRVLFFSHLPVDVPFSISSPFPFYRKTQLSPVQLSSTPFPPTNITFLADAHLLGSERPYRALTFDENLVGYQLPYLDLPGSKAEFYQNQLMESFGADSENLPVQQVETQVQVSASVSLDLRQWRGQSKTPAFILTPIPIEITLDGKVISGFEYWGPFKYKSLGLVSLCYGVEGI
jgi:hypothetical protein